MTRFVLRDEHLKLARAMRWELHYEMEIAVQIILAHAGEAVPLGVYERENAWSAWRFAGPEGMV